LTPKAGTAKASDWFKPDEEAKADSYFNKLVDVHNLRNLSDRNQTYFQNLCELHKARGFAAPQKVSIPNGESEGELWEIFRTMSDNLTEDEEVVFDITHAFRSLPLVAFIAAAYLRKTKNINLKAIIYGAFEAKKKKEDGTEVTPVFDLTPFVDLLDWMAATDKFVTTGNAQGLADLLKKSHQALWRNAVPENRLNLPRQLQGLGSALNGLSLALALTRPHEVSERAEDLNSKLSASVSELEKWAQPFVVLLEKIKESYAPFSRNDLETQRKLICWYVEREQFTQAFTLAREWLVSVTCRLSKEDMIEGRQRAEELLNRALEQIREKVTKDIGGSPSLPSEVVSAWQAVSDLRNDLAHCGFRKQPRPSNKILNAVKALPRQLEAVALEKIEQHRNEK
jgi:CRISPR-associated Csx2 family protein